MIKTFLLILLMLVPTFGFSQEEYQSKWIIGYYEGGPFENYQNSLIATLEGLKKQGWITYDAIPDQPPERNDELWKWLAEHVSNTAIQFDKDSFYSAGWDESKKPAILEDIRANTKIDMIIGMGTWAGKELSDAGLKIPVVVHSSSDAVAAGIVNGVEYSQKPGVHAVVHPFRYKTQVEVFQRSVKFRRLGVFYQDTETGRSYASLESIKTIAEDYGFEIVPCFTITDVPEEQVSRAEESVIRCVADLVQHTDALYITVQQGVNANTISKIAHIAIDSKVPTFSQESNYVKNGIMMSLSKNNYEPVGKFNAGVMIQIFYGVKPEQISQIFQHPAKIVLNIETALRIGYRPPPALIGTADEIFYSIVP